MVIRVGEHTVILSSTGASPLFSGAERYFRTESASPWVAGAAPSGSRKEELVERNASVALKTAVTEIRDSEQHDRSVGAGAGAGSDVVISRPSSPLVPLGVTRTPDRIGEGKNVRADGPGRGGRGGVLFGSQLPNLSPLGPEFGS